MDPGFKDQVAYANSSSSYIVPKYADLESEVYISASLKGKSYLPAFISFSPS